MLHRAKINLKLEPTKDLRERSLGLFQGRYENEIMAQYPEYFINPNLKQFRTSFTQKAPGGENYTEIMERGWKAWEQGLKEARGDLAIFAHYGTNRCLIGRALKLTEREIFALDIPNAIPIFIEYKQGVYKLLNKPSLINLS